MNEDDENVEQAPEFGPQTGTNRYDLLRIALMPLAGFAQGFALMIDALREALFLQSVVHDDKQEAKQMKSLLK